LSGTEEIHFESAGVTSPEQSDATEAGTEYTLPVGCEVPASAPIGPLGTGGDVDGVDALSTEPEVFEHATSAAHATASTTSSLRARSRRRSGEPRVALLASPTMSIITASRSRS
jgi:hypothetical protein